MELLPIDEDDMVKCPRLKIEVNCFPNCIHDECDYYNGSDVDIVMCTYN